MLVDAVSKTADETIVETFDFTAFAASVSPAVPLYILRGEEGPVYEELTNVAGLITVQISGGATGRHYLYGYDVSAAGGNVTSETRRLRVREPSLLPGLPEGAAVPTGGLLLGNDTLLLGNDYVVLA